jgi:hypothetical protein
LKKAVTTAPDLSDLVEATTDDLGVDLEKMPDEKDEERFQQATVQDTSSSSSPSSSSSSTPVPEELPSGDEFLSTTRREMTDLSEARSQLMDELDNITEDLQQILRKAPTQLLSRAPTQHLRGKSIDTVIDEAPGVLSRLVSMQPVAQALSHVQKISRKPAVVPDSPDLTRDELEQVPLEEIQQWLEAAQLELPVALEAIATVLDQLPAVASPPREPQDLDDPPQPTRRHKRAYTEPIIETPARIPTRQETIPPVELGAPDLFEDDTSGEDLPVVDESTSQASVTRIAKQPSRTSTLANDDEADSSRFNSGSSSESDEDEDEEEIGQEEGQQS